MDRYKVKFDSGEEIIFRKNSWLAVCQYFVAAVFLHLSLTKKL